MIMKEKTIGCLNCDTTRIRVLNGSHLKLIAVLSMLIDHIALFLLPKYPEFNILLFSLLGRNITVMYLMRYVGRIAFPIFCFLITEGYIHTSNRKKYGINLFVFAFISEIPFDYAFSGGIFYNKQNVFFTLLFGYLSICLYEKFKNKPIISGALFMLLILISELFKADYGTRGVLMILLLYVLRNQNILKSITGMVLLNKGIKCIVTFIPICMYNGKRGFIKGKALKYSFYVFYPLHLAIIGMIRWML